MSQMSTKRTHLKLKENIFTSTQPLVSNLEIEATVDFQNIRGILQYSVLKYSLPLQLGCLVQSARLVREERNETSESQNQERNGSSGRRTEREPWLQ